MKKMTMLITGGGGDWAQSFKQAFSDRFEILTPPRSELDITSPEQVESYFLNKTFDIIINNAGSIHPKRVPESDPEKWINDIQVNLIGSYLVSRAALKQNANTMLIHISSTAGFNAYADWSSYCAAKAGVITLSKSLAADNYQSYCLCPGAIDTKFRDYFSLPNNNMMSCAELSSHVIDVIEGKYQTGDVLFFRKGEFVVNP